MSRPWRNQHIELDALRVTEAAALAAAPWVGRGMKQPANAAAIEAMHAYLATVGMDGLIILGEGDESENPMLFDGERVGDGTDPETDVVLDAIDGLATAAAGRPNAMAVFAAAERGALLANTPYAYMNKLAVGPEGVGVVDITASVTVNLQALAAAKRVAIGDVTAVVLDRQRHAGLIDEIQASGARLRLITDDDVAAAISTAMPGSGADILLGVGGAREAIISAIALRCLGGEQQAQPHPHDAAERQATAGAGTDVESVLSIDDMIGSGQCLFAATGITEGDVLSGVRYDGRWLWTDSLVVRSSPTVVRRVQARHRAHDT